MADIGDAAEEPTDGFAGVGGEGGDVDACVTLGLPVSALVMTPLQECQLGTIDRPYHASLADAAVCRTGAPTQAVQA